MSISLNVHKVLDASITDSDVNGVVGKSFKFTRITIHTEDGEVQIDLYPANEVLTDRLAIHDDR